MAHIDYGNGYYDGDIDQNAKRHGRGTFVWDDGDMYIGVWKNDKRNGQGVSYCEDGSIEYDGEWKDGEMVQN